MVLFDWLAIGLGALFCLIGFLVGFGRGLRFFTGGFIGVVIAIFVCYLFGNVIYKISFVQELLDKFNGALQGKNAFCDFLVKIHIDIVVYYIALFIIVMILRVIIVKIISHTFEIQNVFFKFLNRTLGMVLFVAAFVFISLFAFWIIDLIGGSAEGWLVGKLSGSALRLDKLFYNNPFMTIIKVIKIRITVPA